MRRTEALRAPRLPIGSRASAYKRPADWLPLRPRCLVRCRPKSGRHRLCSGPAGLGGVSRGTLVGLRAFSRLLWAGMVVALKGRERVVVVFRSLPLHLNGHLKLCHTESCFSDRLVCTCQRCLESLEDVSPPSALSLTKCGSPACIVASRTKVQNLGL